MFFITQLIGLFVVTVYIDTPNNIKNVTLPYGMEPPPEIKEDPGGQGLYIIIAFILAITIFFFLVKINAETFIRIWFFLVTTIALGLALNAIFIKLSLPYTPVLAIVIGLPLAYLKIFKRHLLTHNITELFIYPGIAVVFISLLNLFWMIILLLLISLYDIWAVWHSEFMQKMAKYQINNLKFFTGFFIPYASRKQKDKLEQIKQKYAEKPEELEKQFRKTKIKISLAILGGGDVIFPIITAGIFYKTFGSILPALTIIISATLALLYLFVLAEKGKFYPAMPFLTIGMYLGMIVNWIVF